MPKPSAQPDGPTTQPTSGSSLLARYSHDVVINRLVGSFVRTISHRRGAAATQTSAAATAAVIISNLLAGGGGGGGGVAPKWT